MRRFTSFCVITLLLLASWACDDEPASGGSAGTNEVSFAVSDAPVDDAAAVVVTIYRMVLRRSGHDDVVIDSFPGDEPGDDPVDSIQVDLLDYQGLASKLIVDVTDLDVGEYQDLRLSIVSEDISQSYVREIDDDIREIKVPSGELRLGRFEVIDGDPQFFVIEFDLRHSMTYNPGAKKRYILKPRGVRIVDVEQATRIGGFVDEELFVGDVECEGKDESSEGNTMYLYSGHDLDSGMLGDSFDPAADGNEGVTDLAPYAAGAVAANGTFEIAYLPAGDYTLAFSCDAEDDDPDLYDGIDIPLPATELIEITLSPGDDLVCSFPLDEGGCAEF